jgi:hypothetical protein
MSIVGMDECVARIEEHFRDCQRERDMLYAEDARRDFMEQWDTLVNALLCPVGIRTAYQMLIVEDAEEAETQECM